VFVKSFLPRCFSFVLQTCVVAAAAFSVTMLSPDPGMAAGALAVGLPADVAAQGFAYGFVLNKPSADAAGTEALSVCRKATPGVDKRAQALCAVASTFTNQCFAVAIDPKDQTPGVGWSVQDTKADAERIALGKCRATAGKSREQYCIVDHSGCDGTAK
jgi:Domain of unknown function (DUF4189)